MMPGNEDAKETLRCPICGDSARFDSAVKGRFVGREFHLYHCGTCQFSFIGDPWTEYGEIYSADYYVGRGADPLIDYSREIEDPRSIRRFEWTGLLDWGRAVTTVDASTRWLDFGCGSGGFVTYLAEHGVPGARGYDQSSSAPRNPAAEALFLDDDALQAAEGGFDVLSAVEVVEHLVDPVAELAHMRRLLRPGGTLLITTTNAAPYRKRLSTWRYVLPEVHVSFFEPETLGLALKLAGFTAEYPGHTDGWDDIIRFKVLKNLGRNRTSPVHDLLPWKWLARLADARLKLSAQPIGRAI